MNQAFRGNAAALWRNRGYDDALAGRDRRTDVPDDYKSVYWAGYRRGKEQADRVATGEPT